jgi:raffinose/stachyose/melibiose transport system substrate-binding protein
MAAAGAALLFGGDRLALTRPRPNSLRFAHTFTTESERAILDAVVAEFEQAHPGLRIEQLISNSETYNTVGWRLQFQRRQPPDLYFHWQGFKADQCVERGWALDLAPYLSAGFVERFVPSSIRRQRGGLYFLPHSVDLSALVWFNRDLFAAHELREPASMAGWIKLCERLRELRLLPLAQGNRDLWPMGNLAAELLGQSLGTERSAQLFQPGQPVRAPDTRALDALDTLRRNGAFDLPGVLERGAIGSFSDIDAKVLFLGGKAAQHILGSWFLADVQDARNRRELKFSVGVFPVPPNDGGTDALCAVTTGFLVNPATPNPRDAVAFLELLLSRKYQSRFAQLGTLSARSDAQEFTTDPLARRLLEFLAQAPALVPPPDTGYRPEQAAVFYELIGRLLTGKTDPAQAAPQWSLEKQHLARKGL